MGELKWVEGNGDDDDSYRTYTWLRRDLERRWDFFEVKCKLFLRKDKSYYDFGITED